MCPDLQRFVIPRFFTQTGYLKDLQQNQAIIMTDWTPPDDAKEKSNQTFTLARDTAQNAPCAGKYLRENAIPILVALVIGAALGALLIPRQRKEPDKLQTVRDWLDKTLEDFSKKRPRVKK